ncbi:unnamed protein product [Calypogeia fissa]
MPQESELVRIASLEKTMEGLRQQHMLELEQKEAEYEAKAKQEAADYEAEAIQVADKHKAELSFLRLNPLFGMNEADVAFAVGGLLIHAHKIVLSSRSSGFKRMLDSETTKPKTVIRVEETSCSVMSAVIKFCYTAEINFTGRVTAQEVLKVANQYEIDYLKEVCTEELINTLNKENLTEILRLSKLCYAQRLQDAASKFVKDNFETMFPTVLADL